jgi:hypothetical protein
MWNVTLRRVRVTNVAMERAGNNCGIYEFVSIPAFFLLPITLSVTYLSLPYFPTLSHKRYFGRKFIEHKMLVLIFSTDFF